MASPLKTVRGGKTPPCITKTGFICRGCSGWAAMALAAKPGGPWEGALIHCTVTGLTARSPEHGPG